MTFNINDDDYDNDDDDDDDDYERAIIYITEYYAYYTSISRYWPIE